MVSLDGNFLGFLQFGVDEGEGLMILFPLQLELTHLFEVILSSKEALEVLLEASDAFMLGNHFLEVTPALSGTSGPQVIRKRFKYFAKP